MEKEESLDSLISSQRDNREQYQDRDYVRKNRNYEEREEKDLDFDEYGKFIQNILKYRKYGIIFLGTNDYEKDFFQIQEKFKNTKKENSEEVETAMLVSNGWIYVLDTLFQAHPNLKNIILYDYNPAMIIVYDLLKNLLQISETRQDFITNCFCRKFTDDINDNNKMLDFLKQEYDEDIYKSVIDKLEKIDENKKAKSSIAYKEIMFNYAVKSSKTRQLYPLYYYSEEQIYIDGKKMHTTQNKDSVYDFFTTFYYHVLSPFQNDEQYQVFRKRLLTCTFQYSLSNIYHILGDKDVEQYKETPILIYIDGIDEETCYYLKNTRDFLFKEIQKFKYKNVKIISTKSGLTEIKPEEIIKDDTFQIYKYKRELNYGEQRPEYYPKNIKQMVKEINKQQQEQKQEQEQEQQEQQQEQKQEQQEQQQEEQQEQQEQQNLLQEEEQKQEETKQDQIDQQ